MILAIGSLSQKFHIEHQRPYLKRLMAKSLRGHTRPQHEVGTIDCNGISDTAGATFGGIIFCMMVWKDLHDSPSESSSDIDDMDI
jgi:hypothetical protein